MKKIKLTKLAKKEFKNLRKIQDVLTEHSDIHVYYGMSSYDRILYDMQMFATNVYGTNKFKSLKQFATVISEREKSSYESVIERINKAKKYSLIEIVEC